MRDDVKMIITEPGEDFYQKAGRILAEQVKAKKDSVIGFSTGRTTGGIHAAFCQICKEENIDISEMIVLGLDEVTGVPITYFGSCYDMLLRELVLPLGVPMEHFWMLPVESEDWDKDCKAFTDKIQAKGGIDLLELGLGENAHIGFNQPGTPFTQRCFTGDMHDYLEVRIRKETNTPADKYLGGVTLGIADVLEAKRILLCVNGAHKQEALKASLDGPITEDVPASSLQLYPNLEVVADKDAAGTRA